MSRIGDCNRNCNRTPLQSPVAEDVPREGVGRLDVGRGQRAGR